MYVSKNFIGNNNTIANIITNTYWGQTYDSVMCAYFCIKFVDFMLKGKILLEYTNSFSPYEYKKMAK